MTIRQSALFALVLGSLGLVALSGCSAGNPNMSAAEDAMEQERYERALANVDSAIAQDSANAEAYTMKARVLRQMADSTAPANEYKRRYRQARKAEEKAIEFDPGRRSDIKNQRELAFIREYQKGADTFNQAQQSSQKSDYTRAAAYFGAASAIQPDSTGPILNEAFARLQAARLEGGDQGMQEMSNVIPILERYLKREDEPTKDAYNILAQLHRQDDRPEAALDVTERALEDLSGRPTHFRVQGTRGLSYTATIEAGGSSRQVEGTTPDRIELSTRDGTVTGAFQKQDGGKKQAKGRLRVSLYTQGTEVSNSQTTALEEITISEDLSRATPLAELQNQRLSALNNTGNTEAAMKAYRQQIENNPENARYRYNYGSLLLNSDRYEAAIEQLAKAVEFDADDPKKQYNLGAAYLNKGVVLQDSVVSARDSVMAKNRKPTQEETQMIKNLDEKRLQFFQNAIPPLEKARQLSGPSGQYRQNACSALLQAYVQTEQTEKAEEVKQCATAGTGGDATSGSDEN
ncbi:tetratricopeptide repeat protein [Salinibacter altiplanensis]|uniref:tetratricopeptide repeat protein n=1 Tax=Salinibacter altiplanensis TaxID=1803181 RepID=UPI001F23DE34|nr:tetratricopeptide repeat protein [Salinibacter altiplanensis]